MGDYISKQESDIYKNMAREDLAVIEKEIAKAKTPEKRALLEEQRDKLLPVLDVDHLGYEHCKITDEVYDAMAKLTPHARYVATMEGMSRKK